MLKIVGDINFSDGFFDTGFGVGNSIIQGNNPFSNIKRDERDIWIGNFECVCANKSNKSGIYRKQFIISPMHLSKINHLDIYNVANNHVMQHGNEAYLEMLKNIRNFGSEFFGTNEKKSICFQHQGKNISITGINFRPENYTKPPLYWSLPEYNEIEKEFDKVKSNDIKIVYLHWGNEFIDFPYEDQKKLAHWLVDIGFDLIIGMHPHVMQGYEIYKEKYIFYSLGNFVFNMPWYKTKYSVILSIDCSSKDLIVNYEYVYIGKDYFPIIVDKMVVPENCRFEYLNTLIGYIPENEVYYRQVFKNMSLYRKDNYISIFKNSLRFNYKALFYILFDFVIRKIKK